MIAAVRDRNLRGSLCALAALAAVGLPFAHYARLACEASQRNFDNTTCTPEGQKLFVRLIRPFGEIAVTLAPTTRMFVGHSLLGKEGSRPIKYNT